MSNREVFEDFCVSDPSKCVKIFRDECDEESLDEPTTISELFRQTVESHGDRNALMTKNKATNKWTSVSYREYLRRVEKIAKVFIKLGLQRHGAVAILASNCAEWFVSDLAAIFAGGIFTGIYVSNSPDACQHVLLTSRANVLVVDDAKQMKKINAIKQKLPDLKAIVQITESLADDLREGYEYWLWKDLEQIDTLNVEEEFYQRQTQIAPNECCGLSFTSGTTGNPKGVMVSHDNFTWTTKKMMKRFGMSAETNEQFISYLPLSHMAGQLIDIFLVLQVAGTVYFAEKDAIKTSFKETLAEVRPTLFIGVPRIYEKLQSHVQEIEGHSCFLRKSFDALAKNIALKHHTEKVKNQSPRTFLLEIARTLSLNRKKQALGLDRCRNLYCAAAPIQHETINFFLSLDLPLRQKYGMTEVTVHCIASKCVPSFDTIGRCIDGAQTKILKPDAQGRGEICIRSRSVFMGYINDLEETRKALDDDRWMHTGDQGTIDKTGFLFITGRIKEIIVTSGGENIPPVHIENLVKAECSAISNALLVGDKRKFLTMLITLKTLIDSEGKPTDMLAPESLILLESVGCPYKQLGDVLTSGPDQRVLQAIQEAINRANKNAISNAQKVQKFAILPHDFSPVTGELGPSLKLRRNFVLEKYKEVIEAFYVNH